MGDPAFTVSTPGADFVCPEMLCAHTLSFSTIAVVPWHGDASNVSIDSSRFASKLAIHPNIVSRARSAYVERSELTAVCVEGLVIVLDELFYMAVRLVA